MRHILSYGRRSIALLAVLLPLVSEAHTILKPSGFNRWTVSDGWLLSGEYEAVVPGTVLTTLVRAGVYPDPYYGLNNLEIPDSLCRQTWVYTCQLPLTAEQLESPQIRLEFGGINYMADVYVNSVKLGSIKGAFQRGSFDFKWIARPVNDIKVVILPPPHPGVPHEQLLANGRGPNGGELCLDAPTFICSEGWDWMPGIRDRDMGIWQEVYLVLSGNVRMGDIQVITDLPLPQTDRALVTFKTGIESDIDRSVRLVVDSRGLYIDKKLDLVKGVNRICESVQLDNPQLWMPNGYGDQYIYKAAVSVMDGDAVMDSDTVAFGVREFSYELSVDTPTRKNLRIEYDPTDLKLDRPLFCNLDQRRVVGETEIPSIDPDVDESILNVISDDGCAPYLVIKCNGQRIFCRGGNWGMDDAMKNSSREHLEQYFKLHRDAGLNMIRNWTGESTQETFYQLADEYGMLVWNDFWMSTQGYNLDPLDGDLFVENARDVILRFRNHPSIAIWCPRNEGYAPRSLEPRLSALATELDGTRHYHPNSRYSNLRASGPWHYITPREYYQAYAYGFNTEIGAPSIPTYETLCGFIPESELWPFSDFWCYHDLHFDTDAFLSAIESRFGRVTGAEDFCRKAQMTNYESYRAIFESVGSRMWNDASGALLWMSHPAWPSVEWQLYSYDSETAGSYFGARKACEPVHIQLSPVDSTVAVVNASSKKYEKLKAQLVVYSSFGRPLRRESHLLESLPGDCAVSCFKASLPSDDRPCLARLELKDASGALVSRNDYLLGADLRPFDVPQRVVIRSIGDALLVKNCGSAVALGVKLNVRDRKTGERILPTFFSDGCFNLLPGEKKVVNVTYEAESPVVFTVSGFNVKPSGKRSR